MEKDTFIKIKPLGFQWEMRDPFIFCAHHKDAYPKGNARMGPDASLEGRSIGHDFVIRDGWRMYHGTQVPGFPVHPHRGFETITIVLEGLVDHADSMGAAGRYGNGDVQWMTAGAGIQHTEMFPLLNTVEENPLELFQIWLNLPAVDKFVDPHYSMLWNEDIPKVSFGDESGKITKVTVIAGKTGEVIAPSPPPGSWAADERNEVSILIISMDPEATWQIPGSLPGVNRTLYFYQGKSIKVNGYTLPSYHMAEPYPGKPLEIENGAERSHILILEGRPINEPVVQYGPFVMNTQQEIEQAIHDYRTTRFGGWPWPKPEQVHDRSRGRFAFFADGKEVIK